MSASISSEGRSTMIANVAPAEAAPRDGLSEERLLHGHDAVDRRVNLGVLDLLLVIAGLGYVRRNLGLEHLHLGVRRVEGLLRSDLLLDELASAREVEARVRELGERLVALGEGGPSLRVELLCLEAGDELALLHALALFEVDPGDAADGLRRDLGLRASHDVTRSREDRRGLRRRHERRARGRDLGRPECHAPAYAREEKDRDDSGAKRRHGGVEKAARAGAALTIDAQGRQVGGLVHGFHERRHFTQSLYEADE